MSTQKTKRNDPCPCGSGKKYKQCCMKKDLAPRRARAIMAHHLTEQQETTPEIAEAIEAYEAAFDEIEAATESMDGHRAEFQKMLNTPQTIAERAQCLFTEASFEKYRYPAADVQRACEATAYAEPPGQGEPDYVQFLNMTTAYLTGKKARLEIGRELLQMIPDYVNEERYLDAWLLQFCAHHMAETTTEANPFLAQMLAHGLNEWRSESVTP